MIISKQEKTRILKLHESERHPHGSALLIKEDIDPPTGLDATFVFPADIANQNDNIKRVWYCMDDRTNRGWDIDDNTYQRFNLLHMGIEGHITGSGTDEDLVWTALSGGNPEEQKSGIPKGRIEDNQLQKMMPILSCMKSDKPWEQDYMKDNNLEGKNTYGWIMDDFGGVERCYLQAYLQKKGRGDCDSKHGYFWWDKAANWIKGLF